MSQVATPVMWQRGQAFEVQGHRGARGLRPENTLAGIACALEVGVASIECDVAVSIDGAVVLSHDGAVPYPLHADTTAHTPVGRLALAELRRVDLEQLSLPEPGDVTAFRAEPGQRMATLGAALALLQLFDATDVRLDVEIKSARHSDPQWDAEHVVARVVAEMRAHGAIATCSLRSFDVDVLQEAVRQCPELPRVLLVGTVADLVPAELAVEPDLPPHEVVALAGEMAAVAVAPGRCLVTAELVSQAHAQGLPVIPWTVNEPASVRELVALGVDGVCTDRPDVVRATLKEDGIRLPARHRAPAWLGYGWQAWPELSADAS